VRSSSSAYFDGNWLFHPAWQVRTRLEKDKYSYDLASQSYLDRTANISELGLDYLLSSGSSVGLLGRHVRADYPNLLPINLLFGLNQDYRQNELKLKLVWKLSGVTQLQFIGGRAKREFDSAALTNSSGADYRLTGDWAPLATLKFSAALWKEYAPFEGRIISYSRDTGASVDTTWDASAKVQFKSKLSHLKRDLYAATGSTLPADAENRINHLDVGLTYALRQNVQLGASVYREVRSSNTTLSSRYRSRGATLSANVQF
jgi:hypothetical protein